MRIVNDPTEIDGLRVVQDSYEIAEAMENGETVMHWELGDSMAPIINNAEYCKIRPINDINQVKRGDAVFCKMKSRAYEDYYMVHQVVEISDAGHDGKKWFKIGSTGSDIFGWTQDILGIASGTDIYQCDEVIKRTMEEYERAKDETYAMAKEQFVNAFFN